jgi:hypothetical protein
MHTCTSLLVPGLLTRTCVLRVQTEALARRMGAVQCQWLNVVDRPVALAWRHLMGALV